MAVERQASTGLSLDNKQWGINTGGAVRTSTLPIPFTNVFLAVASTSSEWCCPGCSATNTTVTTRAYQSNRPDVAQPNDVNWIIIGCQPQWGNSWSGYTGVFNWYFPISPSQVYAACLTKHTKNISSSHNWEPARVEEWNNSYARIHPDGDLGYSVIAICKAQQQWGKILGDTVNLKIINFPVSFNECFGGLALFNGDPVAAAEYATITDITNTNFKIYMYANNAGTGYANANIFYLFLGAQQQWGKISNNRADFPIAFTNFCSAATLFIRGSGTGTWYGDNANVTLTGLSCITPDYVLNGNFIVIGV